MAVVWPPTQRVVKLVGVFQQLPCVVFRRVNVSATHKLFIRRVRRCSALTLRRWREFEYATTLFCLSFGTDFSDWSFAIR